MKPHFTHNSRVWSIAFLSVVGLAGYGAATNLPEEPGNRGPVPAELAPAYLDYVVTPQRSVLLESDQLAIPYTMAAVGSRLVVIDVAAEKALHVIDRTTGSSFGRSGTGVGDPASLRMPGPLTLSREFQRVMDLRRRAAAHELRRPP